MIGEKFKISIGSVPGVYHRAINRNNQDAAYWAESEHGLVACVLDGCGSGLYSEIGARLTSRVLCKRALELLYLQKQGFVFRHGLLEELRLSLINFIRELAGQLGASFSQVINDYFLFTIVAALITEETTSIFTLGDGLFSLNGETTIIDENNQPNYLGYALVKSDTTRKNPNALDFVLREEISTREVDSLILGSDGVVDLLERKDQLIKILGVESRVGDLNQFLLEPRYLKNLSALQKRLVVLGVRNRLLDDDTTMVLIRRKIEESEVSQCTS